MFEKAVHLLTSSKTVHTEEVKKASVGICGIYF